MYKIICLLAFCGITIGAAAQDSSSIFRKTDSSGKMDSHDYLAMSGRIMMVYRKGDSIAMTAVMTLTDGTVVKQDGSFTRKNGSTGKLRDGEIIFMSGRINMKNQSIMMRKDSTMN